MRCFQLFLFSAFMVGLEACSGAHEPTHDRAVPAVPEPPLQVPQVNVAALLPLSIDEISRQIGPRLPVPAAFVDPTRAPSIHTREQADSTALFRSQGLAMVVAYDASTGRVNEVLLMGTNENELMARSGLQLSTSEYLVLPFFQPQRPRQLVGLRVLVLAPSQ